MDIDVNEDKENSVRLENIPRGELFGIYAENGRRSEEVLIRVLQSDVCGIYLNGPNAGYILGRALAHSSKFFLWNVDVKLKVSPK